MRSFSQKVPVKGFAGGAILAGILCLAHAAYIPAKGVLADILMDRAWHRSQEQGTPVLPWPWIDAAPLAKLTVPRLNKHEVLLNVGTGQAMGFAPSHMHQTPRPGQRGTSVIAAHKNTHFAFLENMKIGDIVEIENIDRTTTYFKVTRLDIVNKNRSGIDLSAPKNKSQLALVTCYPFSTLSYGGPLRYVVYANAILEDRSYFSNFENSRYFLKLTERPQ